jgi:hypothetical protein
LVKPQDVKVVLAGVAVNPEGHLLAWRHLKAHWHYLQSMFGNSTYTMGTFISAVTSHFTTEYDYQEVQTLFSIFTIWFLLLPYFWYTPLNFIFLCWAEFICSPQYTYPGMLSCVPVHSHI